MLRYCYFVPVIIPEIILSEWWTRTKHSQELPKREHAHYLTCKLTGSSQSIAGARRGTSDFKTVSL